MNPERDNREQLRDIKKRLTESKPRRELIKFLMRQHDNDFTTFTSATVNQWGKGAIGRAYDAGSDWIRDLVKVGYVTHKGENYDGLYELTEVGINFAMDVLSEDEIQKMGILGNVFLSPTSAYDRSTLLKTRGSTPPGTKRVITDQCEPDGWTAKHIDD